MKKGVLILLIFLLLDSVHAATIYGSIYDISLNKVSNARLEINTVPKQHYIAKNGTYSFNVPIGNYMITAVHSKENMVDFVRENISIKDSGLYVLDLIIFPSFEDEKELLKETGVDITGTSKTSVWTTVYYVSFAFGIILLAVVGYIIFKKKRAKSKIAVKEEKIKYEIKQESKPLNIDIDEVIKIIKQEDGRTTQKEIRKKLPLSEAKISLMISELESKGTIKKIKKGRGNIIILNK